MWQLLGVTNYGIHRRIAASHSRWKIAKNNILHVPPMKWKFRRTNDSSRKKMLLISEHCLVEWMTDLAFKLHKSGYLVPFTGSATLDTAKGYPQLV